MTHPCWVSSVNPPVGGGRKGFPQLPNALPEITQQSGLELLLLSQPMTMFSVPFELDPPEGVLERILQQRAGLSGSSPVST